MNTDKSNYSIQTCKRSASQLRRPLVSRRLKIVWYLPAQLHNNSWPRGMKQLLGDCHCTAVYWMLLFIRYLWTCSKRMFLLFSRYRQLCLINVHVFANNMVVFSHVGYQFIYVFFCCRSARRGMFQHWWRLFYKGEHTL